MSRLTLVVALLLTTVGCTKRKWTLCQPTPAGCKVVEVYDDQMTCAFVAMGRNGKDEVLDSLQCQELPEGWQ